MERNLRLFVSSRHTRRCRPRRKRPADPKALLDESNTSDSINGSIRLPQESEERQSDRE
ncbi:hypothetical protein [Paenibacillus sp. NPDC058174]|uniref:hypothetical protein n=1 Tax=Paenibacillus sp. NPDC058174 TaxID=3346366 RepID=UPI0036DE3AF9